MCIAWGYRGDGWSLLACDTRRTAFDADGTITGARDLGGRLRAIPGGWTTATGDAAAAVVAYRVLEREGAEDMAATAAILHALYADQDIISPESPNPELNVLVSTPDELYHVGLEDGPNTDRSYFIRPPELSTGEHEFFLNDWQRRTMEVGGPIPHLQAVARLFRVMRQQCDKQTHPILGDQTSVSGEIEAGLLIRHDGRWHGAHLRGPATDIESMAGGHLAGHVQELWQPLGGVERSRFSLPPVQGVFFNGTVQGSAAVFGTVEASATVKAEQFAGNTAEFNKFVRVNESAGSFSFAEYTQLGLNGITCRAGGVNAYQSGPGAITFRDQTGTIGQQGAIKASNSEVEIEAAGDIRLDVGTGGDVVFQGVTTSTGRSATGDHLRVQVNGVTRYLRLYS